MLRQILSLVLNCEKKKDNKNDEVHRESTEKSGESELSAEVDARHTSKKIPDPWFN